MHCDITTTFLQSTLENEIRKNTTGTATTAVGTAATAATATTSTTATETCEILFEAGLVPTRRALFVAVQVGNEGACRLLVQNHGIDPFLIEKDDDSDENNPCDKRGHPQRGDETPVATTSPFHAAAHRNDNDMIILRYFLQLCKDMNEDCPIHVLCRENKHVSIQAIKLLVEESQANVSKAAAAAVGAAHAHDDVGNRSSLHYCPFHLAVMSDASLDVIYYLLNHFPDALLLTNQGTVSFFRVQK